MFIGEGIFLRWEDLGGITGELSGDEGESLGIFEMPLNSVGDLDVTTGMEEEEEEGVLGVLTGKDIVCFLITPAIVGVVGDVSL
jgi:hypothetical protein